MMKPLPKTQIIGYNQNMEESVLLFAVEVNRGHSHGEEQDNPHFQVMLDRENRVLKMLMEEGIVHAADFLGGGR